MNRRSFIRRSALLLGLFMTDPRQALNCISYLHKSPPSWKDKILQLYPDGRSPLAEILKHSRSIEEVPRPWWNEDLRPLHSSDINNYQAYIGRTRE